MSNISRTKLSIKNISVSLVAQVLTILLNYICRYIFVRTLSQEYLGVNGLFSNILTIFSLAELGIGSAIIYAMYKPISENDKEKIKSYMNFYKQCYSFIAFIIFFIGIVILFNLNFFINNDTNIKNLKFIYMLYLLDSVFSYLFVYKSSLLNATQNNYICSFYQIIGKVIMSFLMCGSLIVFKNFTIYLFIQIICKLLTNILISYKTDKMFPYIKDIKNYKLNREEKSNIYKNVYALFCNQIGNVLINGTDNIIISKYVSLIAVGLYSNYYLIISALSTFIGQIFNSIVASVGNLAVSSDNDKTYAIFKKIHFINFIIVSICSTVITSCINTFIQFSFGEKYLMDNFTVYIILANFYLLSMKNVIGTFKYALGIFWDDKYCTFIRAIINIALSVILVKKLGILGVFIGTLISDILTTFWYQPLILFKKGFNISVKNYFRDFIIFTIIILLQITVSIFIISFISISSLLFLIIIEIFVGILISMGSIFIFFRKSENYLYVKSILLHLIRKV